MIWQGIRLQFSVLSADLAHRKKINNNGGESLRKVEKWLGRDSDDQNVYHCNTKPFFCHNNTKKQQCKI